MNEDQFSGVLRTKYDENSFFKGDAFVNDEGNICVYMDEESYLILTPIMAKKLNRVLSSAVSSSIGMILSEQLPEDNEQ